MIRQIESIERTYKIVQESIPHNVQIDSIEVVKEVEQYRLFWKPDKVNIVLLSESHVYTDEEDYRIELRKSILSRIAFINSHKYPTKFVRFIYCLGYGEDELLNRVRTYRRNTGTPQFWKIFSSCVAENEEDLGFDKILKIGNPSLQSRLYNKIGVLNKMKEKGVWLLDASIVGLYGSGKRDHTVNERIIQVCWKNHIRNTVAEANPKHVIIIGKGVSKIIRSSLAKLGRSSSVIPLPQARGSSEWQLENYRNYQRICVKYLQMS